MNQAPNQGPSGGAPMPGAPGTPQELLAAVPWFRRNSTCSGLLLGSLALSFGGTLGLTMAFPELPLVVLGLVGLVASLPFYAVCFIVLTGDVYYDVFDVNGQLKTWGFGNKVVAGLLLLGALRSMLKVFLPFIP